MEPATHRMCAELGLTRVPIGPVPSLVLTIARCERPGEFERGCRGSFLGSLAFRLQAHCELSCSADCTLVVSRMMIE